MPTGDASCGKRSRPRAEAPARCQAPRRLTAASDFARIYRNGQSQSHKLLRMHCTAGASGQTRVGYVAGRRVGGAVVRNRAKRLMREAARDLRLRERDPRDIVFVAHRPIVEANARDVRGAMAALLQRAGLAGEHA